MNINARKGKTGGSKQKRVKEAQRVKEKRIGDKGKDRERKVVATKKKGDGKIKMWREGENEKNNWW